jgi:hypothetical protein
MIAALFIIAALCFVIGVFRNSNGDWNWNSFPGPQLIDVARYGSPLVFASASVLILRRSHWGYCLGVLSGLIALLWFIWTESSSAWSSWIDLNGPSSLTSTTKLSATLGMVSAGLNATGAIACLVRLLPARWSLRRLPLRQRTWPAFAGSLLIMAVWFMHSVMPYRVPGMVDGVTADLRILYVEKQSLHFIETVEVSRSLSEETSTLTVLRGDCSATSGRRRAHRAC